MLPLAFSHSPSHSYERLGYRIQQAVASPHVQKRQFVELMPAPDESTADWARILNDLENTTGIRVERLESGLIRIGWREFSDFRGPCPPSAGIFLIVNFSLLKIFIQHALLSNFRLLKFTQRQAPPAGSHGSHRSLHNSTPVTLSGT